MYTMVQVDCLVHIRCGPFWSISLSETPERMVCWSCVNSLQNRLDEATFSLSLGLLKRFWRKWPKTNAGANFLSVAGA